MQKKSLLVALFCGALCLTGCLKNEESASVAQVRIAKANELNSIADLNKAKAQAEVIYANAEATIAQAEAKLREANAALVLAQAETEKVRAELLRVKVQLETVKVEEERVKLQMMEAQLEVALANAEAAKAAAAATEQYWINQLEQLLADAQIAAVDNARLLLEAEAKLLRQESKMTASAKVAAQKYFQALDSVAVYQTQLIELKVMRVLANRAAPEIRDNIYAQIDENNAQIAENKAQIEAYKKYQTLTPEEAEAQYQAASEAAGKAYTAWMEKVDALADALSAQGDLEDKTADFTDGWETTKFAAVEAEVMGLGTKTIKGVEHHGIYGEDDEFITLWSDEYVKATPVRYPDIDVYSADEITSYNEVTITPAAIEYDNVKAALDTAVAHRKAFGKVGVAFSEFFIGLQTATLENKAIELSEGIEAHELYVAAMKDSVDKYEEAYLDTLAKSKQYAQDAEDAWEAFQAYMLYTYPTVSRELFANKAKAQKAYDDAKKISDKAKSDYDAMVANIPGYIGDVVTAHDDYEAAIGDYRKALNEVYGPTSDIKEDIDAYNAAKLNWNPNFNVDGLTNLDTWVYYSGATGADLGALYNVDKDGVEIEGTAATLVQKDLFVAYKRVEAAEEKLYILEQALVRNPKGSENYEYFKEQMDAFVKETGTKGEYVLAYEELATAELAAYGKTGSTTQIGAKGKYEKAWESVKTYILAVQDTTIYNPMITDYYLHQIVTYPTLASEDDYFVDETYYDTAKKVWKIETWDGKDHVLGSAQKALVEAVKSVVDAVKTTADKPAPGGELYANMKSTQLTTQNKFSELTEANNKLFAEILRVDVAELTPGDKAEAAKFKDETADALYKDYVEAAAKVGSVDVTKAWNTLLKKGYSFNPDQIGPLDENFNKPVDNLYKDENKYNHQFGWLRSLYNVDYEATCLNPAGEEVSIASFLYPFSWNPAENSLQYQYEQTEEMVEETLPGILSAIKTFFDNDIKAYEKKVAGIVATVNGYKANEAGYKAWVAEREAAAEAVAEATKDEFDARQVLNKAKANYVAARAALNGGVIYEIWDTNRSGRYDFKEVSINEAIAALELENENLEKENERWYQTLSDGKVALALVNQILDEMIEKTEEAIAIWNAIADNYKAIMNAYLGTDDDTTGPLDGEDEE